jgi:hypothetical protein
MKRGENSGVFSLGRDSLLPKEKSCGFESHTPRLAIFLTLFLLDVFDYFNEIFIQKNWIIAMGSKNLKTSNNLQ